MARRVTVAALLVFLVFEKLSPNLLSSAVRPNSGCVFYQVALLSAFAANLAERSARIAPIPARLAPGPAASRTPRIGLVKRMLHVLRHMKHTFPSLVSY